MAVSYRLIDGELVSAEWHVVITEMRHQGVYGFVREGHRTLARQWYFWSLYRSGRGNLAAFPSPYAPHIRTGRIDHAIDFANDAQVFNWLQRNGLRPRRTVRSESWHLEVSAADLRAYAIKHGREDHTLRRGTRDRTAVLKLQKLLRGLHLQDVPLNGKYDLATRKAVRRFQQKHHLTCDGVTGPATWAALRRAST